MTTTNKNCFCGKTSVFERCCQPIITGKVAAQNAEELMRSRFSAYVIKDYAYILLTYTTEQRGKLTVSELANSAKGTQWLSLQVLSHHSEADTAQVEFKAYYQIDQDYYVMHELSDFVRVQKKWLYSTGLIQNDSGEFSPQRNSQCLCGSGKKFKKCCGK